MNLSVFLGDGRANSHTFSFMRGGEGGASHSHYIYFVPINFADFQEETRYLPWIPFLWVNGPGGGRGGDGSWRQ